MRALLVTIALVALSSTGLGDHCVGIPPSDPELTTPATGVSYATLVMDDEDSNPGTYYLENDVCQPDCLFSLWLYEETNGIPGLQRGDQFGKGCEPMESDTIIF